MLVGMVGVLDEDFNGNYIEKCRNSLEDSAFGTIL